MRNKYVKVIDGLVMDVSGGLADWTMVLKADGSVWTTGENQWGAHGDGSPKTTSVIIRKNFVKVFDSGVKAVSAGIYHSQLLKTDGSVWASGLNDLGQLGDGTLTARRTFVKVVDGGVKEVDAANRHSVLLNDKNELCVTGQNKYGELGTGDKKNVAGFDKKCFPRPGPCYSKNGGCHSKRTCIADKGSVSCGDCPAGLTNDGPKGCKGKVTGPTGELFAFYYHTAVLGRYVDTLWGTGSNSHGQLGISTADQSPVTQSNIFQPILSDVKFAYGGSYHTSAVKKDGSVWGAGYNVHGELGDGTKTSRKEFVKSNIESGAVYVSAGSNHAVVLKNDGSLWATGHNTYGSVGDGTNVHKTSFVKVIDGGVADCAAGGYHTMALKTDGSLWATGYNAQGQLGDGTVTNRNKYVQVIDGLVMDVSAGKTSFTIALMSDGSVMGVGFNSNGQLGDGTVTRRLKFVKVVSSGVKQVSTSNGHTQLLKTDGSVWAA